MKKGILILIFFLFLFFSCKKNRYSDPSQIINISFGSSGVQHEDTLFIGDTVHFDFWLINKGNLEITDPISISCETFDLLDSSISSMSIGSSYSNISISDSIYISISEVVTSQSYVGGDNIIVIWPASIVPVSTDSSITGIYILDSLL